MVSALGGQPGWQKGDGFYKAVGMEEKAMSSICGSLRLHKKKCCRGLVRQRRQRYGPLFRAPQKPDAVLFVVKQRR